MIRIFSFLLLISISSCSMPILSGLKELGLNGMGRYDRAKLFLDKSIPDSSSYPVSFYYAYGKYYLEYSKRDTSKAFYCFLQADRHLHDVKNLDKIILEKFNIDSVYIRYLIKICERNHELKVKIFELRSELINSKIQKNDYLISIIDMEKNIERIDSSLVENSKLISSISSKFHLYKNFTQYQIRIYKNQLEKLQEERKNMLLSRNLEFKKIKDAFENVTLKKIENRITTLKHEIDASMLLFENNLINYRNPF